MKRRFFSLCVGLVMLQGVAYGQDEQGQETTGSTAPRQLTQADRDAIIAGLKQELLPELSKEVRDAVADTLAAQKNEDLEAVKPVPDLTEEVAQLRNDVTELGNMLRNVTARAETGDAYWRFDTNSQPARQEFDRALKSTVPPEADFVVFNRTSRDECIFVNGQRHTVAPGTQLTLKVRPGTVTARLPHQQQPLALHVGFPNYYQSVDIKERPATQVYTQAYSEPVYWVAAY